MFIFWKCDKNLSTSCRWWTEICVNYQVQPIKIRGCIFGSDFSHCCCFSCNPRKRKNRVAYGLKCGFLIIFWSSILQQNRWKLNLCVFQLPQNANLSNTKITMPKFLLCLVKVTKKYLKCTICFPTLISMWMYVRSYVVFTLELFGCQ